MRALVAIAELRLREGIARRLAWLVPIGFLAGLAAAAWVPGVDLAARAAAADRAAFTVVLALGLLAAVVPAAAGLPHELRTGAVDGLLGAPLSRLAFLAGGVLGQGALATLLVVGAAGAATLGLEAGGLGAAARDPLRTFTAVGPDGEVLVTRDAGAATIALDVPAGVLAAG